MSDLVLSFYGDDFTGATDVMEVLEQCGVPTVLFLEPPTPDRLAEVPGVRAVGVAGISRTMTRAQMDEHLAPRLAAIRALRAPLFHYKVCSTFDSAPDRGSIGYAAEIVRGLFPDHPIPIVVGVPQLGRYTAFGTLFATFRDDVYRLDRHPAMSVHPSTPMSEADLRRVLAEQTDLPVDLVDIRQIEHIDEHIDASGALILLDVAEPGQQHKVGDALQRLLKQATPDSPQAVIGSSGVEYAIAAASGWSLGPVIEGGRDVRPTVVIVGSRAPATSEQTRSAIEAGFSSIPLDPGTLLADRAEVTKAALAVIQALRSTQDVIVHLDQSSGTVVDGVQLSSALGRIARQIADVVSIPRLVVAGGDTSGLVAQALGIEALRIIRLLAPGSPLCRAISSDPSVDGLEVCLKGGAIGAPDFFVRVAGGELITR
ncbi:MAG: four-carbon acid sugar kinase family protein [Chloroflexi bacterium]|nr:four-carbon acid sugar kinase family protein [Chloroflexota bacterium]